MTDDELERLVAAINRRFGDLAELYRMRAVVREAFPEVTWTINSNCELVALLATGS
jgi:hypothetical protein